eukprot:gnl/MRDRNA2_/MRDRNA2_99692_c0_seq1.p1 gnl/MRDRNA2_/MRDRNA2_99692_c0~~gnl/MRDRNA2_/MRDRNA2_99692_c0_seq1.p1  ORF type:complete len:312 (-),score=37.71 gnl/MRDRNA2_/MRDRNA2_99692_c0_seq1:95-1030(-)
MGLLTDEPLIAEVTFHSTCFGRRILVFCSLLVGWGFAAFLTEMPCIHCGRIHDSTAISMAWSGTQPARNLRIPTPISTWHSRQPALAWQLPRARNTIQPVSASISNNGDAVPTVSPPVSATALGTSESANPRETLPTGDEDLNPVEKLQELFSKYGVLALVVHWANFGLTFGASYALVSNGLQVEAYLPIGVAEGVGNFGVAFALVQATKPFRIAFELGVVPILGRKLDDVKGTTEDANVQNVFVNSSMIPAKRKAFKKITYGMQYSNPPPWLVHMYKEYQTKPEARTLLDGTNIGRQLDDYETWLNQGGK